MKSFRMLLASVLVVLPATLVAQERGSVAGVVIDQTTRQPIVAAQVTVAGTQLGTTTSRDGRFLLPAVPVGERTIRVVFIGYAAGERVVQVAPGATVTADLELRPSAVVLEGVLISAVTGQSARRRELGTNSGLLTSSQLELAPITSVSTALTARVPGVSLQSVSGTVGGSQRIRIRGANSLSLSNEPLIFIDGVLSTNSKGVSLGTGGQDVSRLNDLNQDDIETLEILKGPAASALYGTAAANGVVLITTRRGRAGNAQFRAYSEFGTLDDKTQYEDNFLSYQINDPSVPLTLNGTTLNTAGYTSCANENAARGLCDQDVTLRRNYFNSPQGPFTSGYRNKYGLSASGGREGATFFLSADLEQEQGAVSFNTLDRLSLRANMDGRLTDALRIAVSSNYINSGLRINSNDNSIFSPLINGILASPFEPTPELIAASTPGARPGAGFGYYNQDFVEYPVDQNLDRFIIGSNLNYTPRAWLTANVNLGLDWFSRLDTRTLQPDRLPIAATFTPGQRSAVANRNLILTSNASATSTFQVRHNVVSTSTAGVSFNRERFTNVSCFGVGVLEGTRSCSSTSSLFTVGEQFTETRTIGAFIQQQFGINDRVFVAASLRGDDNSAFGADFGLVTYPSASVSWVVSEESFFPELPSLRSLRLRSAYGQSGLRPDFRQAVTTLSAVSVTIAGNDVSAVTLNTTGNLALKPERSTEWELGFDAGLFDDRVSFDFTYFNKESKDALISRRLAPSFGLTASVFDNLGSVTNQGTEMTLSAGLVETQNVSLNVQLSNSTLSNNIKSLGENVEPIIFNRGLQRHTNGSSAGAYYQRPYTWEDANGDGLIAPAEVQFSSDTAVFIGPILPTNSQSLSMDVTVFRNIRISTLFDRRAGHYQSNATEAFACRTGAARSTRGHCAASGDPDAPLDIQARHIASRFHATDYGYIEKADFIKWREIALTLFAPDDFARRVPLLQGSSLTVSGRNLATWTDYTGLDPEINETGGGANFNQGEFNTAPPLRHLAVRLNFVF
ncbi:MAG TPA: SusC/RagA family TonB-linked outer membrane protein [Gemmatimonadaceae bacterium]|nr:SusC/RagA family TonB-linked outer membrane protein [Gemmatimonadaceae bacterium]